MNLPFFYATANNTKDLVKMFESRLGADKLNIFQACSGDWSGNVKDENLYYFWKSLRDECYSNTFDFGDSTLQANNCLEENFALNLENMSNMSSIIIYENNIDIVNKLNGMLASTPEKDSENNEIYNNENNEIYNNENVLNNLPACCTPDKEKEDNEFENVLNDLLACTLEKVNDNNANPEVDVFSCVTESENPIKNMFPTSFKNSFMWPTPSAQALSSKKKVVKKLIPTVATAEEYMEHLKRVDEEKKAKQNQIDERRKVREMKKKEALPLKKKDKSNENKNENVVYKVGDYVAVIYEGETYPGLVLGKDGTEYQIKTMTMSKVVNAKIQWRWPDKDDILS